VRETLRQENTRIYSEMYEEGIQPFRGTWKSITVFVVGAAIGLISAFAAFAMVVGFPIEGLGHFLDHLFG
jgi:hypothetical protein